MATQYDASTAYDGETPTVVAQQGELISDRLPGSVTLLDMNDLRVMLNIKEDLFAENQDRQRTAGLTYRASAGRSN